MASTSAGTDADQGNEPAPGLCLALTPSAWKNHHSSFLLHEQESARTKRIVSRGSRKSFHASRGTHVLRAGLKSRGLCGAVVTMMQPADSLVRHDAAGGDGPAPVVRRFLAESQMRAVFVVVADVVGEEPPEMVFVHRDDVIQEIPSAAFHPSLGHPVLPRTLERRSDRTHPQRPNRGRNLDSV